MNLACGPTTKYEKLLSGMVYFVIFVLALSNRNGKESIYVLI